MDQKDIDTTINVADPINFSADKRRHLLAELNNRYVGRCFSGVFICAIEAVNRMGPCLLARTNTSGEGSVDVQFRARVAVVGRWDILVGVALLHAQQIVVGKHAPRGGPQSVVTVLAKGAESLAVGQKIAVRVIRAQHPPMQTHVSVVGTLLACDQTAPAYRLQGAAAVLPREARAELAPLLQRVETELERRGGLDETKLWFFERLLYSYDEKSVSADAPTAVEAWSGGPSWRGPAAREPGRGAYQSVVAIARRLVVDGETTDMAGVWSRPLDVYRSSPLVASRAEPQPDEPLIEGSARVVMVEFMKNVLDFLTATRELVEQYDTPELVKSHFNLWGVMRAAQLSPHA